MQLGLIHFNHSSDGNHTVWPDMRTSKWKPNYGDMLVCASIIRQIKNAEYGIRTNFGFSADHKIDRAIIRGSTYLHNSFDFEKANKTIDSIDAPLAIVGLGAQSPISDVKFLDGNRGAKDFIARINERSNSISVRGEFTASVVERLGARNIRLTGCPSLFYGLKPVEVRVPETLKFWERSVGVSIHTGLSNDQFCDSPNDARRKHALAMEWAISTAASVSFFEQGVMTEFIIADRSQPFSDRHSAAKELVVRLGAEDQISPLRLMVHMVSVKSVEEWLAKVRDLDAVVGFRFHGNMVALLQGKPCFYWVYDSRITEFCRLYGLPFRSVKEPWRDPTEIITCHDWGLTNSRISKCFLELKEFYSENGFETHWK